MSISKAIKSMLEEDIPDDPQFFMEEAARANVSIADIASRFSSFSCQIGEDQKIFKDLVDELLKITLRLSKLLISCSMYLHDQRKKNLDSTNGCIVQLVLIVSVVSSVIYFIYRYSMR